MQNGDTVENSSYKLSTKAWSFALLVTATLSFYLGATYGQSRTPDLGDGMSFTAHEEPDLLSAAGKREEPKPSLLGSIAPLNLERFWARPKPEPQDKVWLTLTGGAVVEEKGVSEKPETGGLPQKLKQDNGGFNDKKRTNKRRRLCDGSIGWADLPEDDSWHERFTWPRREGAPPRTGREKEALLGFYQHQFCKDGRPLEEMLKGTEDPCERTLEFDSHQTGSGIGSRFVTVSKALVLAHYSLRTLRINLGDWGYCNGKKCPPKSDICYFEESSACPNRTWPFARDFPVFDDTPEKQDPRPRVRMWFPVGKPLTQPKWESPPGDKKSWGHFWYHGQALYFLLQPKAWLLKRLTEARRKMGLQTPYIAMHVRHGDKVTEGAMPLPLAKYVQIAKKRFPAVKNVLVMTSDQAVINDTAKFPELNFYWTDYPRYNKRIQELIKDGVLDGTEEMVNTMTNFYLAVDSDGLICTLSSNFPRSILRFQMGAYGDPKPAYSLDGWRKDVGIRSFPSDELGDFVKFVDG